MKRFKDTRETIYSFQNEFLVRCPSCNSFAIIRRICLDGIARFLYYRFSCKACGSSKDWSEQKMVEKSRYGDPTDKHFQYSLWLQTPCCGKTLWAYNLDHLDFIEAFVRAELRESKPHEKYGWSNQSLFSRLPKWMQSHKNRDAILKAIAKIRESLSYENNK